MEKSIDFNDLAKITFAKPDEDTFRCLALAKDAGRQGGLMPTIMNAANEVAVDAFLHDKIGFLDIADTVEAAMTKYKNVKNPTIEEIINADAEVKNDTQLLKRR